uniref:HOOK N-terminal domain-containing protein n=1 Tax=Eptatretus burgeri TaxID=7764 RepID=A0A8C4N3F5_EPTBU
MASPESSRVRLAQHLLASPLVVWVRTLGDFEMNARDATSALLKLLDGSVLHDIMRQIHSRPAKQALFRHAGDDPMLRAQNLALLLRQLREFYQEELQQLIVMPLPDVITISRDPFTEQSVKEFKKLLLLMLGSAVQCERKEMFIEKIKDLNIDVQAAIVVHIQEVTQTPENVLELRTAELAEDETARNLLSQLQRLAEQRDRLTETIIELNQKMEEFQKTPLSSLNTVPAVPQLSSPLGEMGTGVGRGLAVELAESKASLRRLRREL